MQAFRYSAVDYLLKPVKVEELIEAVAKTKSSNTPVARQIGLLLENLCTTDEKSKKLSIANAKGFDIVKTSDIILIEADGYCTRFHISGKSVILSSHILKHYEEILPKEQFMRVHHSYLINKEHLKGYLTQGGILLSEDIQCPLSSSHKTEFLKIFRPQGKKTQ